MGKLVHEKVIDNKNGALLKTPINSPTSNLPRVLSNCDDLNMSITSRFKLIDELKGV
jgi:hypothetical protein